MRGLGKSFLVLLFEYSLVRQCCSLWLFWLRWIRIVKDQVKKEMVHSFSEKKKKVKE